MRYALSGLLVLATGCLEGRTLDEPRTTAGFDSTGAPDPDDDPDPGDVRFDVGAGSDTAGGSCDPVADPDAVLTGRVFAPNGQLPISGALVWLSEDEPGGVPEGVYCESCVEVPCKSAHTITAADGSFTLEARSGAGWLVVQKGAFLRSTPITVDPGTRQLEQTFTTLPAIHDPAGGTHVPRIALAYGDFDRLENGLAKLGLGQVKNGNLVGGTEAFDVYLNADQAKLPKGVEPEGDLATLLTDYDRMARYQIIFVPCTGRPFTHLLDDPLVIDNIRRWVSAGGKWYVADWSNEFLERPFPKYQSFWANDHGGMDLDRYDTVGTVRDEGLRAWLDALPPELADINPLNAGNDDDPPPHFPTLDDLPELELLSLWSAIKNAPAIWVDDGQGGKVNVGHKVWIEGPGDGDPYGAPDDQAWPLTVTGEYGCGRILFTSYHTVAGELYEGLTPQELVLTYLILEMGVCQMPLPPPAQG